MTRDPIDPKGLIAESYRIEGIGAAECRSIFLDWALSMGAVDDPVAQVAALLSRHGADYPDHPMTHVLREGLATPSATGRRGGRSGRRR